MELWGFEVVHVEGVLEVGRMVRREHEHGAFRRNESGEFGHVALGLGEVLDHVRGAHPVDAVVAQAEL